MEQENGTKKKETPEGEQIDFGNINIDLSYDDMFDDDTNYMNIDIDNNNGNNHKNKNKTPINNDSKNKNKNKNKRKSSEIEQEEEDEENEETNSKPRKRSLRSKKDPFASMDVKCYFSRFCFDLCYWLTVSVNLGFVCI